MIKSTQDLKNIPQEISYNKITIALTIATILISYVFWQYSMGFIIWFMFSLLFIVLLTFCFIPLPSVFFAIPLTFAVAVTLINSFSNDFYNTFMLNNVDQSKMAFYFALPIKDFFIKHPELGALWTGILLLVILWAHPKNNEKRIAYNPLRFTDYIKEEPKDFRSLLIKIIIAIVASCIQSKIMITILIWYLFFKFLIKSFEDKEGNYDKNNVIYFIIFFVLTWSYAIFGSDKAPLDALISIITMNP